MSEKRSYHLNLSYRPLRGFDRSKLSDSPLLPTFKDQLSNLLTQVEHLKGIFLAFTNLIFITVTAFIIILLACLYFTFYTLVGVWILMVVALCFSNYQVRLRVRMALNASEVFEEFVHQTGNLFLINVKLGKQMDPFFRLKRYNLIINIDCFDQALIAEEDELEIIACGRSEKMRRNSFSHQKKNQVANIYKLNNKNIVDYRNREKRNSVMSGKLSKDSIKRYMKARNSDFKRREGNGVFFDKLEDVIKDDYGSYSEKKPNTTNTFNDFKSNYSDTKVTCGERKSFYKLDSVNLNSKIEASLSNKENIKSLFHNKHKHTSSIPFIRGLSDAVGGLKQTQMKKEGVNTDRH